MPEIPITSFKDDLPISSFEELPISSFKRPNRDEILKDPVKMSALRAYMVDRIGVQWENKSNEDILDTYLGHMRFVNTNELRTLSEARYIQEADDKKKTNAAMAYSIYEEMAPFWKNSSDALETIDAVKDYGLAVLTSPSTYIGGVFGKVGAGISSKVAVKGIMSAARQAARQGGKEAAEQVFTTAARNRALVAAGTGTAVDSAAGIFQDIAYQDIMKDVGVQDEHNYTSTVLSGLGGVAGGLLAYTPEIMRGSIGVKARDIRTARVNRQAKAASTAAKRIKQSVSFLVEETKKLQANKIDWPGMVARGRQQTVDAEELSKHVSWFFDVDNPNSIARIVIDSGANLANKSDESFTKKIISFVNDLPTKDLEEINETLKPVFGITFGEMLDRIAAAESRGGSMLQAASKASKYAKDFANISAAVRSMDNNLLAVEEAAKQIQKGKVVHPEYARYVASLWRRMLVSHPGTTAVNVQGWGMAYLARSLAEITYGGILGAAGIVGKTMNRSWSEPALRAAKANWQNQIFKARMTLDPYSSRESFDLLLKMAPAKIQEQVSRESFGGFGHELAPEVFGINPQNKIVKGAEGIANAAARASFIRIQDYYTKAFSGLAELDRMSRINFNKGIDELIKSGEYYKITDEMWEKAVSALMTDTFSKDYTRGRGALNYVAAAVEKISDAPYLGFLFPFGRFMNNSIAFTLQYSPIAFVPLVGKMKQVGVKGFVNNTDDIGMNTSKAIVGTVALATLIKQSMDSRVEGKQWYEVEESTGDITDESAMAPISNFRILARLLDRVGQRLIKGEAVPPELYAEVGNVFGMQQWAKELTGDTPLSAVTEYWSRERNPDDQASFMGLLSTALTSLSGQVVVGFTRPLDPVNKAVGMFTETDASIDRRQAQPGWDRISQELTRYTDNIFDAFLDEPIGTELRQAAKPEGDIKDPNPMASMVGRKELPPKNYIDRLLATVDMPPWKYDQRSGIPEADRFMNEKIAPYLNYKSKGLLNNEVFKKASPAIKREMVKLLLSKTRDEIKDMLTGGHIGTHEDRLANQRRIWLTQPKALRDEARIALKISTPDRKLSEIELLQLRAYLSFKRKFYDEQM